MLLEEIISSLKGHECLRRVLDGTLGLGGYSEAVLASFPEARVWGVDQDEQALQMASERLRPFAGRFAAIHGNFSDLEEIAGEGAPYDAVLFDLGVSNLQISDGERGFSFQYDGPLDMRMDQGLSVTAADIVNECPEKDLAEIFWKFGEERFSREIARGIVRFRQKEGKIRTTATLVAVIRDTLPAPVQRKMGGHPARRVFQALRIKVNDELEALSGGLRGAVSLSGPGGLILVVSYHSLEDRIVKHQYREWQTEGSGKILTKHPLLPGDAEVERNFKARSAKLRVFRMADREKKVEE